MKQLIDDTQVDSRTYYYLLDFNDRDNWDTILTLFDTGKLCELEISQFTELFRIATQQDLDKLNSMIK